MTKLPREFLERMRAQLGGEYEAFLACYEAEGCTGLRVNTQKISVEAFLERVPFHLTPVPWTDNGFYCSREEPVTRHPYYYAGLYYIQEPSAMLPAAILPVQPGDMVLDLCAAPGGKATELSLRLRGEGLLVANDVSASRAKALLKNLEVWGAENCCITGETPQRLLEHFGCFFDRILVDAPCSGEGMFRRDPGLAAAWEEKGPAQYAEVQREILSCAARMLKPGGSLVYSTCTFSETEDEEIIEWLLREFPELELCCPDLPEGLSGGRPPCGECVRIWPHRVRGEGHFAALLRRRGESGCGQSAETAAAQDCGRSTVKTSGQSQRRITGAATAQDCRRSTEKASARGRGRAAGAKHAREVSGQTGEIPREAAEFLELLPEKFRRTYRYRQIGGQCLLEPPYPLPEKLRYLRTGILAGTLQRGRFEPSQALAMLLDADSFPRVVDFAPEDMRTVRYLKGETVELAPEEALAENGWVLICTDGHALGWGRYADGRIKNRYYPGWRLQG